MPRDRDERLRQWRLAKLPDHRQAHYDPIKKARQNQARIWRFRNPVPCRKPSLEKNCLVGPDFVTKRRSTSNRLW